MELLEIMKKGIFKVDWLMPIRLLGLFITLRIVIPNGWIFIKSILYVFINYSSETTLTFFAKSVFTLVLMVWLLLWFYAFSFLLDSLNSSTMKERYNAFLYIPIVFAISLIVSLFHFVGIKFQLWIYYMYVDYFNSVNDFLF